ncbi:MAG: DUF4402 domain-containing protein [Clostridia bacterium]|nr:DUF4402 domain-containing protein [Bacteroidales bacterium]NCA86926.1 DUF4402 domain-containing protein [Clostridia bacterium]
MTFYNQPIKPIPLFGRGCGPGVVMFLMLLVLSGIHKVSAQQTPFPPPNQMEVYSVQQLNFGSFTTGAGGGTVVISPEGFRSSTGSVILMGGNFYQALFEIKLIPGRLVQIIVGPQVTLNRIGGGGSMNMQVGPTDKGSSFVTTLGHPFYNPVGVGGTLFVGNTTANPAGVYEGQFSVTFIQE